MPEVLRRFLTFQDVMRHYNVWQLAHAIAFLQEAQQDADFKDVFASDHWTSRVPDERMNNYYRPMLQYCESECKELELTCALARFQHFNNEIRTGISWAELRNQIKVLHEAIHADLCYRRFAYVPTAKATLHDKFALVWENIWKKVPDAKEDSQRAIDCYALEQNTACVFHLMRVAEFGLRSLAKTIRVRIKHKGQFCPLEYGEWNKIIAAIRNKIDPLRQQPIGLKREAKLEFYSDVADHCTFMKDIWRNNVSHAREPYNETEALAVLERVRGFMKFLAAHLPEAKNP
ncbi:MAG: hypothetical protein WBL70_02540 [Candidatus Acidiferrales bacterium]